MVSQPRPLQKAQEDEDQEDVCSTAAAGLPSSLVPSYAQLQQVSPGAMPARCLADASFPNCLQVRGRIWLCKSFAAVLITLQEQVINIAHALACN